MDDYEAVYMWIQKQVLVMLDAGIHGYYISIQIDWWILVDIHGISIETYMNGNMLQMFTIRGTRVCDTSGSVRN